VHGFKDTTLVADVAGWGQAQTADQTGAHVGQNVAVQVGHDEDLVVVRERVGHHLQAGVVEELGVEFNVWVLFAQLAGGVQEQTVRHLHDGCLVHGANLLAADVLGVLEGEAEDALGGFAGDELDRLDDAVDHDVLDTGVFSFGVLTDEDGVDIVVGGLVAGNRFAGTQVGEKVECAAECQVERDVALANRGREWSFEGDVIPVDTLDGCVWDDGLAVLELRRNIDGLPLDRDIGGRVDVLD